MPFYSMVSFLILGLKIDRYALTAEPKIRPGLQSPLVSTFVSIAPRTIAI